MSYDNLIRIQGYIYIYAFSRRFYPKQLTVHSGYTFIVSMCVPWELNPLGVDRYVFFRADADTDYYRSSRPITDILNRYTCLV